MREIIAFIVFCISGAGIGFLLLSVTTPEWEGYLPFIMPLVLPTSSFFFAWLVAYKLLPGDKDNLHEYKQKAKYDNIAKRVQKTSHLKNLEKELSAQRHITELEGKIAGERLTRKKYQEITRSQEQELD